MSSPETRVTYSQTNGCSPTMSSQKRFKYRSWLLLTPLVIGMIVYALLYSNINLVSVLPDPGLLTKPNDGEEKGPKVQRNRGFGDGKLPFYTKGDSNKLNTKSSFLDNLKRTFVDDFIPLNNDRVLINDIDNFNNIHLAPRLKAMMDMDYFRFIKLNFNRKCTLWSDDTKCSLRDCTVQFCDEAKLPIEILQDDNFRRQNEIASSTEEECDPANLTSQKLSALNVTVPSDRVERMNSLFECSEHDSEDSQYIDLQLNPETYTGYSGESAWRIWKSIYEENCFLRSHHHKPPFSLDNLCYEERIFYRAISGLHSSINIHVCASYHIMDDTLTHNLREFTRRFQDDTSYLKNLYFLYLLELRALHKAELYLLSKVNWKSSGNQVQTREAMKNLMKIIRMFKWHFDESYLFKQESLESREFAEHFHNITTNIMDCVGCDKCKVWGKVQIHGLGTAFKILMTEDVNQLVLNRHEIVSLINGLTRLSCSISELEIFNKLMQT